MPILAVLLLGTGIYLTALLRFMPIYRIPAAFALLWKGRKTKKGEEGQITPFAALMTALSSTVGTGNLAGVATAITLGGPGAIFWMWMTALVGMATKYAESMLAVRYREVDEFGNYKGGPMYYIKNGLGPKWKWLAILFSVGAMCSAVTAGNMVQSNGIAEVANHSFNAPPIATGLVLEALAFVVIIGGIKSIGKFASKLVPFMAFSYVAAAILVLIMNASGIPTAFKLIFTDAFNGQAAVGGFSGAVVALAIRAGIARGLFSNEAGQGSAPIAHAAAKTKDPVQQGTIAMLGTFIDTIVICTMTALVILTVKGNFTADVNGVQQAVDYAWQSNLEGARITSAAFEAGIPGGGWIITFALMIFAFTTILGWSYYGERAISYLFGEKAVFPFRIIWCIFTFGGAMLTVKSVWKLGDIGNALMAAPNLVALLLLSGVVASMTRGGDKHRKIHPHDESEHAKGLHSPDG
ncbi:MAG TPA: sodium:alanine symporter family protein [Hellea balneolensis]|uniref:Sodium:alanine symporter family protein n=1 Tax=Hellea balneolensis TaxID=287478 RepID=A0A7C5QS53_9PROT|nr:sodium:alanine symporter family protein [Hellea balneolensis]